MRENNNSFRYVSRNNEEYQYGSAAPAYAPRRSNPGHQERPEHRKAKRRHSRFSLLGMGIVIGAFAFLACMMVNYVRVQSELTSTVKAVANKQVALNNLVSDNDELYSRIISSVDLEQIEATARGELGMNYAGDGQVITYASVGNDYMRKVDSSN